jgi:D-3-phosphoglycerate dehydrogenase
MSQHLVLQTEDLEPAPAAWLAERCELIRCPADDPEFDRLLPRANALLVRTYTRVTADLLDRAPNLKVVARAGVALENIDLPACRQRGVTVVHTPGANTRAVVEYVTALILDALRRRTTVTTPHDSDTWTAIRTDYFKNPQLSDLPLGLLGFGRIGAGMARVGAALDMRVLFSEINDALPEAHGAKKATLEQVLAESDIVSVHVDSRPTNKGMLTRNLLDLMKPGVLFINSSRGFVLDPTDLRAFLHANPDARAMLDVHDPHEPIGPDYPLLGVKNATLLPHIAAGTTTAKTNMSWVVRDLWRVLCNEAPECPAPVFESAAT